MSRRLAGVTFLLLVSAAPAFATDLKIKDSKGTEVTLANVAIDYGSFLSSDKETLGIRLMQGDGSVTVTWADLESLQVLRTNGTVKPPIIEVEVLLKNGKKSPAALFTQGNMKLLGKSDLGDYSIDLAKVRSIVVVR